MCHKKNTRCFVGTAVIALLVIISLTYQRAYNFQTRVDNDLLSAPRPDRTAVESAICPASSDFGVLLNKPPLSQQCNNGVTLPYVGELAALGEPNRCFHASARFDQYRSPEWQELSWGKSTHCILVFTSPNPSIERSAADSVWFDFGRIVLTWRTNAAHMATTPRPRRQAAYDRTQRAHNSHCLTDMG